MRPFNVDNFEVRILSKDFSGYYKIPGVEIIPVRYRKSVIGGCVNAEFKVKGNKKSIWNLFDILRGQIEIYYSNQLVWYGYIDNVKLSFGAYSVGLDLTNMSNRIAVSYSKIDGENDTFTRATTTWGDDITSIAEYGCKELMVSVGGMNDTQAINTRNVLLNNMSKPLPYFEYTGEEEGSGVITAKGWYNTLDWRYYSQAGTDIIENTSIISEIVSGVGQFIPRAVIDNTSGLYSTRYRIGDTTGWAEIVTLLNNGTVNGRRLLAEILPDRFLRIYEEPQLSSISLTNVSMFIYGDGTIRDKFGSELAIYKCPTGIALLQDSYLMDVGSAKLADPRVIFVEEGEYSVGRGYTPIARGAPSPWDIVERVAYG